MKVTMLNGPGAPSGKVIKVTEPTTESRMVDCAHDAKVSATAAWINGHIPARKHAEIHKRADAVIKAKGKS